MKNLHAYIVVFIILGLFSCDCDKSTVQPFAFHFLVNKKSDLYKDINQALSKKDYTDQPPENRGFNNVYFLKGNKKIKMKEFYKESEPGMFLGSTYMISLYNDNTLKKYGYFTATWYKLAEEVLTNKTEEFYLVYDDKKILLKINGKLIESRCEETEAFVREFYVNEKKHKFINDDGLNIVLYLAE